MILMYLKKNRKSNTKLHNGFFRFRKHSIYFFLEDNSITVVEEKRPNSGEISILIPVLSTTIEYLSFYHKITTVNILHERKISDSI